MSKIATAIFRSFLLWWHLGIGPLIGAGPMQARADGRRAVEARSLASHSLQ